MRQGFSALVPVFSINMNDLLYCIMIHIYFHYIFFTLGFYICKWSCHTMECMINTLSGKKSNLKLVLNSSSLKIRLLTFLHIGTKGAKLNGANIPFLKFALKE